MNSEEALRLGQIAMKSGAFGVRTAEEAAARILVGVEMGLAPMASVRLFHNMSGKLVLSSDGHVAVCKASAVCEFFRCVESTDNACTFETKRRGEPEPHRLTFGQADAERAGLWGKGTWKAHPAAMLRARCGAALARLVYPDVVGGCYSEDEGEEIAANEGRRGQRSTAPVPQLGPAAAGEVVHEGVIESPATPEPLTPDGALTSIAACETLAHLDELNIELRKAAAGWTADERTMVRMARDAKAAAIQGG